VRCPIIRSADIARRAWRHVRLTLATHREEDQVGQPGHHIRDAGSGLPPVVRELEEVRSWGEPHRPGDTYSTEDHGDDVTAALYQDEQGNDGPDPVMGPRDRRGQEYPEGDAHEPVDLMARVDLALGCDEAKGHYCGGHRKHESRRRRRVVREPHERGAQRLVVAPDDCLLAEAGQVDEATAPEQPGVTRREQSTQNHRDREGSNSAASTK